MVQGLLRTSSTKRLGMIMPRYIIAHRIAHCARFRFHAPAAPVRHGTVWRLRRPTPAVLLSQLRLASPARGAPCCAAACSYPYPFAVAAIPEGTSTSAPHSRGVMSAVRHFSGSLPCQRHDSIHDAHHDVCVTVGRSQLVHARIRLDIYLKQPTCVKAKRWQLLSLHSTNHPAIPKQAKLLSYSASCSTMRSVVMRIKARIRITSDIAERNNIGNASF